MTAHLSVGSLYSYTITSGLRSDVEFGDKKHESGRKVELNLNYEVVRDSADTVAIRVTYKKLHLVMNGDDGEKEYTAMGAGETGDPIEKFFGSLLGSEIVIYLDRRGNVLKVDGYEAISAKILESINVKGESIRNNIRRQMSGMVGEEFIKNTFQQMFKVFPDTAVKVGDSWSRAGTPTQDVKIGMGTTYTLHSIEDGKARVNIRSALAENKNGDSINILGYQALASLEGEEKGRFDVDTVTGMLVNGVSSLSLEGKIQVMGRDVPVKINSERKVEVKKIH